MTVAQSARYERAMKQIKDRVSAHTALTSMVTAHLKELHGLLGTQLQQETKPGSATSMRKTASAGE